MTHPYDQFNIYDLNNMIMEEESSSENYNYYNKYHNSTNPQPNLFEFCPEIKQFRQNLKTYQSLNSSIIKWYESVIRECVHQNDQHKKSYQQIEGLLNLNQPQLKKIILERNVTPIKLNNLKLMLDQYTSIHYRSQLEQVQNQLEVYQRKNRDLTGFMKCWNTDTMMQYSFTKRLLTPEFAKEWSDRCKIFKNGKIVKVQQDLQKPCFSIVQPTIQSRKKKKEKFITFKITNVPNKFLYLGIVKIKTAQQCNFVFDRKLGKGAYVIAGHTGYSFSNDFQDQNFKATAFKFLSNDIVTLQYDPITMKVNFVNQTRNLKTSLRVKQETSDDPLHFCAVIFHQGTQIQIISSEEI